MIIAFAVLSRFPQVSSHGAIRPVAAWLARTTVALGNGGALMIRTLVRIRLRLPRSPQIKNEKSRGGGGGPLAIKSHNWMILFALSRQDQCPRCLFIFIFF